MSMNEAMNGMMNQGNATVAQVVEQFGTGTYESPIVQAVSARERIQKGHLRLLP